MKPAVFITREIPKNGIALLKEYYDIELWEEKKRPSREILYERARNCDALVTLLSDPVDDTLLKEASNLRIIAQYAVGYDNIAIEAATNRGVYVTNTPEVLTDTTADLAFSFLLATARNLIDADALVRSGQWKNEGVAWHPLMYLGHDIYEKTLGIIGFGRIGQAVAKRAQGFGMRVLYWSRTQKKEKEKELHAEFVDLKTLLKESDFVSLHVPLTDETEDLIGENELHMMKDTSILINTARGNVVNTDALIKALKNEWIAGAGLDVFEEEPYFNEQLFNCDHLVVTPHIGSATHGAREAMAELVAENLIAFAKGNIPPTLINREVTEVRRPGF